MEYSSIFFSTILSLLIIKLIISSYSKKKQYCCDHPSLPPTPPSLPILGHLHLFKKPLHRTLAGLASRYGPVFLLRFGSRPVLVVSSLPLFEECFTKNDIDLANRPQLPSSKSLTYNFSTLASAPYGPHWRNIRRIATVELLSSARLQSLSDIRYDEVKSLICDLFTQLDGQNCKTNKVVAVELKPRLFGLAFNVMMRMIAGKRCEGSEEARRFREVVEEGLAMLGASNVSDFLPALRWVDFGGVKKRMKAVVDNVDAILQALIDENRMKMRGAKDDKQEDQNDEKRKKKKKSILEVLLDLQEEAPEYYSDEIIKAMIVTLFFAGTDTSTVMTEWAMSLLLNHPEALQRARDEIDSVVGKEEGGRRLLQEQDLQDLPYLQAIISETLRLCPAAPLLVPHEARQECTVGGYRVPRGTMILANAWAIHRDLDSWTEPTEFRPERFLNGGSSGGRIIPFGMGRRRCPGDGLAAKVVGLVLGNLIQCFEWERTGEELIDMEEAGGLVVSKANLLRAMCRPRKAMIDVLSRA